MITPTVNKVVKAMECGILKYPEFGRQSVEAVSKNCIKDLLITPSLTGINLKVITEASRYTVTIENNDFKKTLHCKRY